MTRWPILNTETEPPKDLISTSETMKATQSVSVGPSESTPNHGDDDNDDFVSTSASSTSGRVNGYNIFSEIEEENWEPECQSTQDDYAGNAGNRSFITFNGEGEGDGDATVSTTTSTTTRGNYSGVSSTTTGIDWNGGSNSQGGFLAHDFLKDTPSSITSMTSAIPLPPPPPTTSSSSTNTSHTVGGNSTFHARNAKSPSPIQSSSNHYWDQPSTIRLLDPGDIGLQNIGNTCFMNSALQCLIHTAKLAEFFLAASDMASCSPSSLSLIHAFQSVMFSAWMGSLQTIYLTDFRNVLGNIHSQFKDGRQHDCQEFLALTLDTMHEQLKKWNSSAKPHAIIKSEDAVEDEERKQSNSDCENSGDTGQSDSKASEMDFTSSPKRKKLNSNSQRDSEEVEAGASHPPVSNWTEDTPPPEDDDGFQSTDTPAPHAAKRIEPVSKEESEEQVPPKKRRESLEVLSTKVNTFWSEHLAANNTVIASSFQGVFKSTVICSVCSFVSVTYEPFMYLTLPIPRTVNRTIAVTFYSLRDRRSFKSTVLVKLVDTMAQLKEEVVKSAPVGFSLDMTRQNEYVIAEVYNYHVAKAVDNFLQIKYLDDNNKNIYMYELNDNFDEKYPCDTLQTFSSYSTPIALSMNMNPTPSTMASELSAQTYLSESWEPDEPPPLAAAIMSGNLTSGIPTCATAPELPSCSTSATNPEVSSSFIPASGCSETKNGDWLLCCICQEECLKTELKRHDCGSILCKGCITRAAQYFERSEENIDKISGGTHLNCPICRNIVPHEKEYIPCWNSATGPTMFMTSILFRLDPISDTNNNSNFASRLFGVPLIVKIPSTLPAEEFYEYLNKINPFPEVEFKACNVSRDGVLCNHCLFTNQCKGCEYPTEGEVCLTRYSSIALCYTDITEDQIAAIEPQGMATSTRPTFSFSTLYENEPTIDIHYCLKTFSESEILDDQNPWYCPTCAKNQCATKTMTVCRFPDYLIVYLKRFVFVEHTSNKLNNKLTFPLTDLDVSSYLAPESSSDSSVYDLYSCICHFGTASAGHYTAYGKNPVTGRWHDFNDSSVNERTPGESEYSSAYVLFYQRKGIEFNIPTKPKFLHSPLSMSSSLNRPIGVSSPISYGRKSSTENRVDSSRNPYGDGQRVRVVDQNTPGELSLSVGNSKFKGPSPNHSQSSSTKYDYSIPRSLGASGSQSSQSTLSDEELPDIPDDEPPEVFKPRQKCPKVAADSTKWSSFRKGALTASSQNGYVNASVREYGKLRRGLNSGKEDHPTSEDAKS